MGAYRQSLENSIVQEQRYDFHFFNDKRWIARPEFADLDPAERPLLFLFTAADLLDLLKKVPGQGYLINGGSPLGRYRREAYLSFRSDPRQVQSVKDAVEEKSHKQKDWRGALTHHIEALEKRVELAADPKQVSDHFLSLDIYQIHQEIRALQAELRVESLGL
jgi:hypothetical protein